MFSTSMATVLEHPILLRGNASRDEILFSLFKTFEEAPKIESLGSDALNAMKKAAVERERTSSTFLGRGLAVPHGRTELLHEIHIAVGVSEEGVAWPESENRTHLILLLGVPSAMIRNYLLLMQKILRWHKDTKTLDAEGRVLDAEALVKELTTLVL